ncbi:hypothetical protein HanPI659440_Chr02g0087711 [Helianthus annuus]|nr:hypothetical protein HanPI659440_Chr02g0087711 [Helianthus annuus]
MEGETRSRFNRICVFCGSSPGKKAGYQEAAIDLGKELVYIHTYIYIYIYIYYMIYLYNLYIFYLSQFFDVTTILFQDFKNPFLYHHCCLKVKTHHCFLSLILFQEPIFIQPLLIKTHHCILSLILFQDFKNPSLFTFVDQNPSLFLAGFMVYTIKF